MRNSLALISLAAGLTVFTGCDVEDFGNSERYTEDFHHAYPLKAGGRLSVENFNGSIEITGWDENSVEITGSKYAATPELRDAIKIEITAQPDSIYIRTVRPSERRGSMGAKYIIKVPRRTELDRIASSNGSIRASDVEGVARFKTSNGSVRTLNLKGGLDVQTSNGAIEVQKLDGPATLRTSNGRIRAEDVNGAIEANTSNGGINVQLAKADANRPIKLESSNGGVDLTMHNANQNDVRISTSNGGITVHLPESLGARLIASTSNNSISTEFEVKTQGSMSKNHLEGTIGAGGPTLDLQTTNGSIRLLKM